MNRRFAAAGAVALALPALAATAQAAPPAPDAAPVTLALTAVQTQVHPHDVKPKGPSVGDRITFSEDLFAPNPTGKRGARLGTDGGECVVTNVAKAKKSADVGPAVTTQCTATLALKDGLIAVQGLATSGSKATQQSVLAITGGTGAYTGARGTMTITGSATEATSALVLDYTLP